MKARTDIEAALLTDKIFKNKLIELRAAITV